jgi:hypothetical protein
LHRSGDEGVYKRAAFCGAEGGELRCIREICIRFSCMKNKEAGLADHPYEVDRMLFYTKTDEDIIRLKNIG